MSIHRGSETELEILRLLLREGLDINLAGDKGRNVLHNSVNKSGADADQSLDLEMTLLR